MFWQTTHQEVQKMNLRMNLKKMNFNEFEKINTHIYIVCQIDKNIRILIILNTVI